MAGRRSRYDRAQLECQEMTERLDPLIKRILPRNFKFMLMVFKDGEAGAQFVTDEDPCRVMAAMKTYIQRHEGAN